jgi:hypothetical protein
MLCVLKENSTPLLIVVDGRFSVDKLGNDRKLPMHVAMQPLEQYGPERWCWGCERTLADPASHRLAPVGCWLGLGGSPGGAEPRFGM